MTAERSAPISVQRPRCPFCTTDVAAGERKTACDRCMSWHHTACWQEHGACAACGHAATADALRAPAPQPAPPRRRGLAYGLGMLLGLALKYRRALGVLWLLAVLLYMLLGALPPP